MIQLKSLMLVAIVFFFIDFFLLVNTAISPKKNKLLLILLDAFRWDYMDRVSEKGGFKTLIKNGVKAQHMVPIYPSESYPNYFAITTGLYAENHGVVSNYMYDPDEDIIFNMGEDIDSKRSLWFDQAEPIWITAEKNNISTACLEWPSADVPIRGILPRFATSYELKLSPFTLKSDLLRAVDLLAADEIQFGQVFTEWTDAIAHTLGPSVMKNYMIPIFIDGIILDFLNYVKLKKLDKDLNIILLSDHGMTYTGSLTTKSLKLDDVFDVMDTEFVINHGSHMGIYPIKGKEDKIYNQLKNVKGIKIRRKDEIPDCYHLKNNNRVPPIHVEVLKGYYALPIRNKKKQFGAGPISLKVLGYHGYNPDGFSDMWGTFIATGPAFKKGVVVPSINTVDVYNLLTYLLDIPSHPNNGTWDHIKEMLI